MRNAAVITLSMVLAIGLFAPQGASGEPQTWKIGHVRPAGSAVDRDLREFAEGIRSATGDRIRFEIHPANKLGDYSVVQERVAFGEVEMYVGPFGTATDRRLELAFTPYLVSTWAEAQDVYARDGRLFGEMADVLERQNIKVLAGWPVYFGGIALTRRPEQPGNPEVSKDMIIRVPPIRTFERTARALGYTPYPITWTYAKMGLKTGMVAGILGGGAEGYLGLKDLVGYYVPVKDHFEHWYLYMNLDLWKSLPDRDRTVIEAAAAAMESRRFAAGEGEERGSLERLAQAGVEVLELSDAERSAMRDRVRETVWPAMRSEIGEAFDRVVSQVPGR